MVRSYEGPWQGAGGGDRKASKKQLLLTTAMGLCDGSMTELESGQEERSHPSGHSPAFPTQLHAPDLVSVPTPRSLEDFTGGIGKASSLKEGGVGNLSLRLLPLISAQLTLGLGQVLKCVANHMGNTYIK